METFISGPASIMDDTNKNGTDGSACQHFTVYLAIRVGLKMV